MRNLTRRAKIIISSIIAILLIAGVIGGSFAIANAVKRQKQSKCAHVYDSGNVKVEATCETVGLIVYTCNLCEYKLSEEIPANGHAETLMEEVAATCTTKGLTDGVKCVSCGKILVAQMETPLLGHKITVLKAVAATCTTTGKTEGTECVRCGEIIKKQQTIQAKGHTVVELKGYPATCTEVGRTNGSSCSGCGKVYSVQEIIPALGHTDANEDRVCDVCEETGVYTATLWEVCEDISELKVGDQIMLVVKDKNVALGKTQNTSNRSAGSVRIDGDTLTPDDNVQVIILEEGTIENTFAFNVGAGYLYASSSSNNQLKTRANIDDNASWRITVDETGVLTIQSIGSNTKNNLMYNSVSNLFSCYESGQTPLTIYKLVEDHNIDNLEE